MAAIFNGATGFRYDLPNAWLGTAGDISGGDVMHAAALFMIPTLGVQRGIFGCRDAADATVGWALWLTSGNALTFTIKNAAGSSISAPTLTLAAGDVGKLIYAVATADGTNARLYCKRVQQGAASPTLVGYKAAPAASTTFGAIPQISAAGLTDHVLYGAACGRTCPTLAQIQANHDAVMANEEITWIPGYSEHLWSLKPLQSLASIADRIGTATMTQTGTLTPSPQYARAWAW